MTQADEAHAVLTMLCPLADPENGTLMGFDGRLWPTDGPTALTALALLPRPTLDLLARHFPEATPAARHQIAEAVGMLASTVADGFAHPEMGEDLASAPFGAACRIMTANVGNVLVFSDILDGVCGDADDSSLRDGVLPVALKVFETGEIPLPPEDASEDTEALAFAALPQIDYLDADPELRERAGAFLMAFVLAHQCRLPYREWARFDEPADSVSAFARGHLAEPGRWAAAVREHRSMDPDILRPVLGDGAAR